MNRIELLACAEHMVIVCPGEMGHIVYLTLNEIAQEYNFSFNISKTKYISRKNIQKLD